MIEYIVGALTALFILVLGFVAGFLLGRRTKPVPADEKTEEQERIDKQWQYLFRYNGKDEV